MPTSTLKELTAMNVLEAQSKAPNTLAAYRRACAAFSSACPSWAWADTPAGPAAMTEAAPEAVAGWAADQWQAGAAAASIALGIAGVDAAHREAGLPRPGRSQTVRRVMAGVRRSSHPPAQAPGLTNGEWGTARAALEHQGTPTSRRDLALLGLMRDCLLRRGEAAAVNWEHLTTTGDGSGTLTVPRSKTDQVSDGAVLWVSPDTMENLASVWKEQGTPHTGPVFLNNRGPHTGRRMSARAVGARVTAAGNLVGVNGLTGHSMRVGMAQDLAGSGVGLPDLMASGRWASPAMPARYTRHQAAPRSAVARYHRNKNGRGA